MVKYEASLKELGELKAEKTRLAEKAARLEQERQASEGKVVHLKGEKAKWDLTAPPAPATPAGQTPRAPGACP